MTTESDAIPISQGPASPKRIYNYEITTEEVTVESEKYINIKTGGSTFVQNVVWNTLIKNEVCYLDTLNCRQTETERQDAQKFIERAQYATEKFEYPRNGNDPGLVLIFNQENFTKYKSRKGSRRDVNEIIICFQRQGFNIDEDNIVNDGTREQIMEKLRQVVAMDLSQKNSLIIFFLTHGDEYDRLHTYDGSIETREIWSFFTDCKDLRHKPKMFIFQACKGENYTTTTISPVTSNIVPYKTFSAKYMGPDMLVVYSTIEGNVSFRHPHTGSWFIQELCKNFSAYGKRDDVVSLIIRTTKCICGNYFHHEDGVEKKQMPMFVSTLSKKFYLNRNKDRDLLLRVLESNEQIIELLNNIKDKVNNLYLKEGERKKRSNLASCRERH